MAGSLQLASFTAVRRVLTLVCHEQRCTTDPVADLATAVRRGEDGPALLSLPPVPTLSLMGDHDLSTPPEWPRQEVPLAPRRQVLVVHGAGHSVQSQVDAHPEVLGALEHFLGR